jgi:hypothetical protein
VYRIDDPFSGMASAGQGGLVSALPQVLGGGSKTSVTGMVRFSGDGRDGDPAPTGGEAMPDTSYWSCDLSPSRQFFGATSTPGTGSGWFGIESTGTPAPAPALFDDGLAGTLAKAITATATEIPVEQSGSPFNLDLIFAQTEGHIKIGSEYMKVTEICFSATAPPPFTGTQQVWRVVRGQHGSAAATHADLSEIRRIIAWPRMGQMPVSGHECYFRTSAPAFSLNGTAGGTGTVAVVSPRTAGADLSFSGGLLVGADHKSEAGAGFTGKFFDLSGTPDKRYWVGSGVVYLQDNGSL